MRTARWLAGIMAIVAWLASDAARAGTLYDDLGRQGGVDRLCDRAVTVYMSDPRLARYFDNIDAAWLKHGLARHLCMVTGGGCLYRGRSMAAEHRGLHITQAAFNAVVEDFQLAMRRQGIGFRLQNRVLARLAPMERDIVSR